MGGVGLAEAQQGPELLRERVVVPALERAVPGAFFQSPAIYRLVAGLWVTLQEVYLKEGGLAEPLQARSANPWTA